jgi:hypothetical protein
MFSRLTLHEEIKTTAKVNTIPKEPVP